ncbi:hypothetical protein [Malaciobacter marinus]|uniref:hypothetical protein n=1 Tax=Malaciobacter marinus TaxID=505249 RepID=UPI003AFFA985
MTNPMTLYDKFEPSFSLIQTGYNLFDEWQTKRHREMIISFHRNILDGVETEERIEYEKENIKVNPDDYYTLLEYALKDEEKEKVNIYSNVYKYIRDNQNIEKSKKRFIIKSAKELPYSAIELLVPIYIYDNYHTKYKNLNSFIEEIYSSHKYESKILENNSLLHAGRGSFGPMQYSTTKELLNLLVNSFFKPEDLNSSEHNIEIWNNKNFNIITERSKDTKDADLVCEKILSTNSIKYKFSKNITVQKDFSHIIIVMGKGIPLSEANNFNLNITLNTKVIKVTTDDFIGGSDKILNLNSSKDIDKLKEFILS